MTMTNPDTGHIHIVAYNSASNSVDLNHHFDGKLSLFEDKILNKQVLRKIQKLIRKDDQVIVVINAQCYLPEYWLTRLLATLNAEHRATICSALTTRVYQLTPLAEADEFNGKNQRLDQLIFHLRTRLSWFETDQINPACFAVNMTGKPVQFENLLEDETQIKIACDHLLVQPVTRSKTLKSTNIPKINNQKPLPSHPLAVLQARLSLCVDQFFLPESWLRLDAKPVVLHTCMDWDGGVQKWVNDVCAVDKQCHHLVLLSKGEYFRQRYGEQYSLFYAGTNGLEIARFEMTTPITSTITENREYRHLVSRIIKNYDVQAVIVSTLIGHSMDCLNTGLPTIRIFHDYFPHWPALLATLDNNKLTKSDLEHALQQTDQEPFGTIREDQLTTWRNKLEQLYSRDNVVLIAPDQSVIENLKKISQTPVYDKIKLIPHGIRQFTPIEYTRKKHRFTILVPGRIGFPKGKQLLDQCLPKLTDYRVILLGAGNTHNDYDRYSNVDIVAQYQTAELKTLLQHYQPDVALILSTVSETFSYTLSEMFQAGIPVIATSKGALKQRIKDGKTGFLIKENAVDLVDLLNHLSNHPEILAEIRNNLSAARQPDLQEMVNQYHQLWKDFISPSESYQLTFPDYQQDKVFARL
ncbi:MAG TPA: glycosyltransferase, partial [Crenotrichaceae bacterium]|nr:glycosyltransferase [Crenotrichaceae bacterium]